MERKVRVAVQAANRHNLAVGAYATQLLLWTSIFEWFPT
jgi:hypothetical protein